jgi:hypothetical protein
LFKPSLTRLVQALKTKKIVPMKALKSGFAFAAALLLMNACSKETGVSVQPEAQLMTDYELVDFNELEAPDMNDGISEEFKLRKPGKHIDKTPCDRPAPKGKGDGKRDEKEPKDPKRDLGGVLQKLDLNKEQKAAIAKFMHEHCMCIAEHLKKVNEANREIMAKFNRKRDELIKAHKEGRITKEELDRRLGALKEQMKQELAKHDNKEIHMHIMKTCEEQLLKNIGSVLNSRQAEMWKKWLENRR